MKATVTDDTKGATVLEFIGQSVESEESALITDEYKAYTNAYKLMSHRVIKHGEGYVDAEDKTLHINTIEGFGLYSSGRGTVPITNTRRAGLRCL